MDIYTFSHKASNRLATQKIIVLYPMLICVVITSIIVANVIKDGELLEDKNLTYIIAAVGLIISIAGFFSGKKGAKGVFDATKFLLDEISIEKQVPNTKNIKIDFRDIKSYRETKSGIRLRAKKKQIFIPSVLTDYHQLVSTIKKNIQSSVINYSTKFKLNEYAEMNLAGFGLLALVVSFFVLESKLYKLLFGIPLLIVLLFAIFDAYTNKHRKAEENSLAKVMLYTLILMGYLIYIIFYT